MCECVYVRVYMCESVCFHCLSLCLHMHGQVFLFMLKFWFGYLDIYLYMYVYVMRGWQNIVFLIVVAGSW